MTRAQVMMRELPLALVLVTIALSSPAGAAGAQQRDNVDLNSPAMRPLLVLDMSHSHANRVLSHNERHVPIPGKPPRSALNKHLLVGAGVGALIGSVVYLQTLRPRCTDCWSIPHLEIPMYVGGGALAGYAVGGAVFFLRSAPKKGDAR
ncbi:MAG TPA: hypothetical protein VE869_01915 [Gemmatimonas sp.]|nr:hypothetical protein [Gemmatimonas sp.]